MFFPPDPLALAFALADALRLAMCAGEHFQVDSKTQYADTMIAKCIDQYIAAQTAQSLSGVCSGAESKEAAAADGGAGGG